MPHRHYQVIVAAVFSVWWAVSLRVKPKVPLGEDELPRVARKRK